MATARELDSRLTWEATRARAFSFSEGQQPRVMVMKYLFVLALAGSTLANMQGCDHSQAGESSHGAHVQEEVHAGSPDESARNRPSNQVAVLTVWAEADELESTVRFYEDVLGLRRVGNGSDPYILDTDGTFVAIMEGQLDPPHDPKRRWPMFALTVADLDHSIEALRDANVELPWGIEEFGSPKPSSRYVMFYDPAGNLIEIVEWL